MLCTWTSCKHEYLKVKYEACAWISLAYVYLNIWAYEPWKSMNRQDKIPSLGGSYWIPPMKAVKQNKMWVPSLKESYLGPSLWK